MTVFNRKLFIQCLFPIFAVAIWATNAVVSKMATATIEPGAIAFYRWFVALLVLSPFCLVSVIKQWAVIKRHLIKLTVLASLGMVLNQSLAYYAAYTTSATNIAIFLSLMPLIGLFLAVPLLGSQLRKTTLIGAVISFSGLLYMLTEGNPLQLIEQGLKQGDMLMLASTCAYALYSVLLNKWKLPLTTWCAVYCQVLLGALLQLPLLFSSQHWGIENNAWPMVGFAALAASIIAPWCWLKGVAFIGAERATLFMNLVPIFTASISVLLLGVHPTQFHLIGGGLVFIGLTLAQYKPKPQAKLPSRLVINKT
ncbi:DMT family transporter [Vibrio sp. CK2-1]|uniref:DMT family transporter n=1 Tax=Vibrio sp. CK2-1 TaxID=2912249 RepID=UPI001F479AB2|nr:DMT family transporter [Vibrio sp. CK2-1]MCF7355292.1 DMT family transporter [Vibrio sp. CK2-1]